MASQQNGLIPFFCIAILISGLGLDGCKRERPNNIPRDSVYVEGGEAGWWQHCSYDLNQDTNYCQIYNLGGETLYDEIFLPYDGGKAVKVSDLNIDGYSIPTGPNYVHLKNGRILIPKSIFERESKFLDYLKNINVVRPK
jgi:uncharacterized protein YceK